MIQLQVMAPLAKIFGVSDSFRMVAMEIPLDPDSTLHDLFCRLAEKYPVFKTLTDPDEGRSSPKIIIAIDGKLVTGAYADVVLPDGAEVSLLPAYAGG